MRTVWHSRYALFIHSCDHGESAVTVRCLKGWFSKRELRTESRKVFEACFPVPPDADEAARVRIALEAAAACFPEARD
jgi:hypothetical protein